MTDEQQHKPAKAARLSGETADVDLACLELQV